MWSLREREDGSFYLTFDKERRRSGLRGVWERITSQDNEWAPHFVRENQKHGYLVCNDDEGGVRVLILE